MILKSVKFQCMILGWSNSSAHDLGWVKFQCTWFGMGQIPMHMIWDGSNSSAHDFEVGQIPVHDFGMVKFKCT